MKTLEGRRALVTGASSGIGRATALTFAAAGAAVILNGRSRDRLEAVAGLIRDTGGRAEVAPADLADAVALAGLAARVRVDGPDVLVHSAGAITLGSVAEGDADDLDRQWRVNARAPYLLTRALLPGLVDRRGDIVFVNSGAGVSARGGWSQYAMTKHALRALSDSLRDEVADRGVRVISVYPGRTATPMQEDVHRMEGRDYRPEKFVQPEDVARQILAAVSLPPSAVVTDVHVRPGRA